MGVTGLMKMLKDIQDSSGSFRQLGNLKLCVDLYGWLYKGKTTKSYYQEYHISPCTVRCAFASNYRNCIETLFFAHFRKCHPHLCYWRHKYIGKKDVDDSRASSYASSLQTLNIAVAEA